MSFMTDLYIRHLETHGYRVMSLSDPPDSMEAVELLRQLGYQVFPPLAPPPVGSIWAPTRGEVRLGGKSGMGNRRITAATPTHVTYRLDIVSPGSERTITLRGWHEWVRRARAKQIG